MIRFVPMDRLLLRHLIDDERDPLSSEMADSPVFADRTMMEASRGLAWAGIDGATVAVGGSLTILWAGRAEAWWLVSRAARPRHLVAAARFSRSLMDKRQRDPLFRRIEIFVRAGERWSESFAAAMGFVCEGYLCKWDPKGRDCRCFARVAS